MDRGSDADSQSIGGLFARLADDATGLVRAEVELYRATALNRLDQSRPALIALIASALTLQAAFVCLLVMIAVALSAHIGAVWAGLSVALAGAVVAALLAWGGIKRLREISMGDEND